LFVGAVREENTLAGFAPNHVRYTRCVTRRRPNKARITVLLSTDAIYHPVVRRGTKTIFSKRVPSARRGPLCPIGRVYQFVDRHTRTGKRPRARDDTCAACLTLSGRFVNSVRKTSRLKRCPVAGVAIARPSENRISRLYRHVSAAATPSRTTRYFVFDDIVDHAVNVSVRN